MNFPNPTCRKVNADALHDTQRRPLLEPPHLAASAPCGHTCECGDRDGDCQGVGDAGDGESETAGWRDDLDNEGAKTMSRSGYVEDWDDNWQIIMGRGAVASAIKGKRGQALLREMLAALDAMPEKRLIAAKLEKDGCVCALGAVGKARGVSMSGVDPEDKYAVADLFGVAPALAAEIVYENDEGAFYTETPEARFQRMRRWVEGQIRSAGT